MPLAPCYLDEASDSLPYRALRASFSNDGTFLFGIALYFDERYITALEV